MMECYLTSVHTVSEPQARPPPIRLWERMSTEHNTVNHFQQGQQHKTHTHPEIMCEQAAVKQEDVGEVGECTFIQDDSGLSCGDGESLKKMS